MSHVPSPTPTHIAGDWGTTHLRLHLCRGATVLDLAEGAGIGSLTKSAEATLFDAIAPWVQRHGPLPILLAGMIGSRNGWKEVPYASCPAGTAELRNALLRFEARGHQVAIATGVSCINPHGAPDVMRGEETQILGAIVAHPELGRGRHIVALPGTHTKWALVEDGKMQSFQTSLSGELYALLRDRSTLLKASAAEANEAAERRGFDAGLQRSRELRTVPLSHLLFEVRARQLVQSMPHAEASAFLSGLIIGQDVLGALPIFDGTLRTVQSVPIIGAPRLAALYSSALAAHGIGTLPLDATALTVAGLNALAHPDVIAE
ncbi:2-dehydro-3-deoxygalactonokinase [Steroidobacter sp.]|uniref:2-dehydro-3-deoxygalactonokinase n=1 Tax=Steroidobacter sp. TaxID=1978227 RepID=UPI001A4819C6|nr:2-dehydro-3-deoxygalactonokinase [Steroidobacter sp.]MBL8269070.1 2-dehydro-3-deoxygalactonokinase [Steroidobacter sp.]